ncbi:MAG: hypothetical protein J2O46_09675, partial [Nocardioides sp.]|nr:hypothetical protein [Nocardioides sp.]
MTVELRAPFAPAAEPPPAAASRSPRLPQPPMWLVVVAGVVLVVTLVAAFLAALRTGIPIDEPYHVTRLRTYMATGHFAMPGVSGADLLRDRFTYAPVTMLALHALCWVLGIDGFGTVSTTATAYAVRHVGVFLMGVVGLGAVAGTARVLLRSWRWGVVAAALLAAMPTWMGHLAFNIKDIPVATGASLVTFGLVWLAAVQWRERSSWPAPVAAGVVLTSGLVLALGTRVGMWPLLAAQVVAYAALLSLARRMRVSGVLGLVVPGVVAYAVLVLVYPYVFAHPLLAMRGSVSAATEFRPDPPSRTYVPEYLIVEVPTLMLLAAGVGSLVAIVAVVARLRRPEESTVAYAVVGLQALLMPALSVAEDASLYSGLRQLLFVFPGLAILAAVGLAWLLGRCRPGGWARPALAGLLAASALLA